MKNIEHGSIYSKKNGDRGWIIGDFEQLTGTPFKTNDFEIRWSKFVRGEKKTGAKANKTAKTVAILVSGKVKMEFPSLSESHILAKEGDYMFWGAGVSHSWEALEDSLIIAIRWPSLKNDQV